MNIKTFRLTQGWPVLVLACSLGWSLGWPTASQAQEADTPDSEPDTGSDVIEVTDDLAVLDGIQQSLDGPDVVITAGKERTVFEYRQNGQLRLVKVVPRLGRPYYLVPADQTRGFGDLGRANTLLPQWTIIEF